MEHKILVEKENGIASISFNDPKKYNSFGLESITELANSIITLAYDPGIKGIIITGKGKAFCTGGDLKWAAADTGGFSAAFHELSSRFHQAILEIRNMRKPVLAAINGIAAGGGFSLALACDFRVMAKSAVLKQGFTSNGLSIDGGGTYSLPRLVGIAKALEIIALDESIDSGSALALGLVTRVVDDADILTESYKLMERICGLSLHSFACSKELVYGSLSSSFESQLERERERLSRCAEHQDGQEGIAAFLEKRKPVFNRDIK